MTVQRRAPTAEAASPLGALSASSSRADGRYESLAAAAGAASGVRLLELDGELQAEELEAASDFRWTYLRATLAVYGRDHHHEAFHHLSRAAEKALRTNRGQTMRAWLEQDAARGGCLRKLAVGHAEWGGVLERLERHQLEVPARSTSSHAHEAGAP